MKIRIYSVVAVILLFFMGKRAASVHSAKSYRVDCLRNAECVCNNIAFVRSPSTAGFHQNASRSSAPAQVRTTTLKLIIDSAASKTKPWAQQGHTDRLYLKGPVHLRDYWINCSSGESTTAAYWRFNPSCVIMRGWSPSAMHTLRQSFPYLLLIGRSWKLGQISRFEHFLAATEWMLSPPYSAVKAARRKRGILSCFALWVKLD